VDVDYCLDEVNTMAREWRWSFSRHGAGWVRSFRLMQGYRNRAFQNGGVFGAEDHSIALVGGALWNHRAELLLGGA